MGYAEAGFGVLLSPKWLSHYSPIVDPEILVDWEARLSSFQPVCHAALSAVISSCNVRTKWLSEKGSAWGD